MDNNDFTAYFGILNEMYQKMCVSASGKNHAEIFRYLGELARTLIPCDDVIFWRWEPQRHMLWTIDNENGERREMPDFKGLIGKALAERTPLISDDPYRESEFSKAVDEQSLGVSHSLMVMPVADLRGVYIGAFQLRNSFSADGMFDLEADSKRLSGAALIAAMVMESDPVQDDLRRDLITQIKNKNGFYNDYSKKYFRQMFGKNSTRVLSLFLCEIDGFAELSKRMNEEECNRVLRAAADMLTKNRRDDDDAYWWAGGRFLMMLNDTDLAGCVQAAERLRGLIEKELKKAAGSDAQLTVSIGCIEFDKSVSMDDNFKRAEQLLASAQNGGGNAVKS
ncbi:MAG: diguanylate cyclase [Oscillospiraceae bacterium]|nr:diguanylate cyclase [Oscillospiraceae bacterium]